MSDDIFGQFERLDDFSHISQIDKRIVSFLSAKSLEKTRKRVSYQANFFFLSLAFHDRFVDSQSFSSRLLKCVDVFRL